MSIGPSDPPTLTPTAPPLVERVFGPFHRFAAREASGGIVLLACALVALAWANSPWAASYHHLWETELAVGVGTFAARVSLHHFINDGLMAVFFFVVGLEIKREVLVGELGSVRQAALPVAAALGGMAVPAVIYATVNVGGAGVAGWGIPMATDIAFALGVLALLGTRAPASLKVFLAAVAIADDIGAVLVIAVFYTEGVSLAALALAALLLALSLGFNRAGVRTPVAYALVGVALWAAVLASGVHATVAGVLLAFTIPARTRVNEMEFLTRGRTALREFDRALDEETGTPGAAPAVLTNLRSQEALHTLEQLTEQAQPPLSRLEHGLHGIVAFGIIPLFAFANAGVSLGGGLGGPDGTRVAVGIFLGLVVGKMIGIGVFSLAVTRWTTARFPAGLTHRRLFGVGALGGIGFTMALFIAELAFRESPALLDAAKIGVLAASAVAGAIGWVLLSGAAGVRREDPEPVVEADAAAVQA